MSYIEMIQVTLYSKLELVLIQNKIRKEKAAATKNV